jgi:hypothetical protein
MHYLLENISKRCLITVALIIGCLVNGCATYEPQPVTLKELNEIQPKELLQKEKFIKPRWLR